MFAQSYFERAGGFKPLIPDRVFDDTRMIVVIPCLMEPDVLRTLQSLRECEETDGYTEIILLINESENCSPEISEYNQQTLYSILQWKENNFSPRVRFFPVGPVKLPAKWAGVGLARKAGMDEALFRFNDLNKPEGIIVSLDADSVVDHNYLRAIEEHFRLYPEDAGATIRFCHQTGGLPERQVRGIRLYEKYMEYYKNALSYAGYPHALYTIGSAFAVKAEAYMRRGGMTRRKAGEDFYFLQTLTQTGHVGEIESTCVHPSARISQRVPFGTGIVMKKWMDGSDELLFAYNLQAFSDLKIFFSQRQKLFNFERKQFEQLQHSWPEAIHAFITAEGLMCDFEELSHNCSRAEVFSERFFQVFNAFRILKFLNFSHQDFYKKTPLDLCCEELKKKEKE